MTAINEALGVLQRDGFAVVDSFFTPEETAQAHREIMALRESLRAGHDQVKLYAMGKSTEILANLYGTCPTLDRMADKLLTDPRSAALLERIGGKHLKNRDFTVRIMTGEPDDDSGYNPPLEWHRDSKGEFVIGIYLTDCPPGDNSATAYIPGSSAFPYDPRWNVLFGRPFYLGNSDLQRKYGQWYGLGIFLRLNLFGRILGKRLKGSATGAFGKAGDFYLWINETWHGRLPNKNGLKVVIVQLGFFPSEFPFPDSPPRPTPERLAKMPAAFRDAIRIDKPHNPKGAALVYDVLASQRPAPLLSIFGLAKLERKVANLFSIPVVIPYKMARRQASKVLRPLLRR